MIELLEKKLTVWEFQAMDFPDDDPFIYELIDGILMKKQAPSPAHQQVSSNLHFAIKSFLAHSNIGIVFYSPIDVFFDNYNNSQPDLIFISKERDFIIDKKNGIMDAPDLIIEIISPSSVKIDRITKKALYEKFGVKEYWLVDPLNMSVEIYSLADNQYLLHQITQSGELLTSPVLKGFELLIDNLF